MPITRKKLKQYIHFTTKKYIIYEIGLMNYVYLTDYFVSIKCYFDISMYCLMFSNKQ